MECGRSSGVEHNLAKVRVVSSNLIARSKIFRKEENEKRPSGRFCFFQHISTGWLAGATDTKG